MTIKGRCLCRTVSYEITGVFVAAGHCHCSIGRKSHGAAFATWAHITPDQFLWRSGVECVEEYESSPGKKRCFCRKCGSPLVITDNGRVTEVVLGTVDDDPGVRPGEHIFVQFKAPWYDITDDLPQYDDWPTGMTS
ncbi:MAG: GFA family protein [Gammaproteobacteria bacterium]